MQVLDSIDEMRPAKPPGRVRLLSSPPNNNCVAPIWEPLQLCPIDLKKNTIRQPRTSRLT